MSYYPIEDAVFGDTLIYCRQHLKVHETGWCSVSMRDKVGLGTNDHKEAVEKCRDWGFVLYRDPPKLAQNPETELVRTLYAEIERLQKFATKAVADYGTLQAKMSLAESEITRLQAALVAIQEEIEEEL